MSEGAKTLIFVALGVVAAGAAVISRPRPVDVQLEERIGGVLFEKFDDPARAARMEIVKYDAEMGELRSFEIARERGTGAWTIPSHAGYPADAETRMRDAALLLVDLKVLGIASQVAGDHRLYGVLEPDRAKLRLGDEGVGELVSFEDGKGQDLASLIIGKPVKDAEDQRFVRIPGQDVVYAVKIDPGQLSTRFQDWIEQDLLKLSPWDIENVTIKNYNVERMQDRAVLARNFDFTAKFTDNAWQLVGLTQYGEGEPATTTALPADQELNKEKLDALKTAVDELKIIDVLRKPKGLGSDLKAGSDFLQDPASEGDLRARGFYAYAPPGSDSAELLCANGEVHVGMKDGVQYVLRFGETVPTSGEDAEEGKSRYLFVTARVDMSKFPQPQTETPPELPAAAAPAEEAGSQTSAEGTAAPAEEGDQPQTAAQAAPAEAAATEAAGEEPAADEPATDQPATDEPTAMEPAEAESESAPAADEAPAASVTDDPPAAEEADADAAAPEAAAETEPEADGEPAEAPAAPAAADREAEEARILQERERINRDNQRKLDEWNEKVQKAKERVAELNTRFGDWYYVVSEAEYDKIRLPLSDLIKAKAPAESEGDAAADPADNGEGIDAFRHLQGLGLPQ